MDIPLILPDKRMKLFSSLAFLMVATAVAHAQRLGPDVAAWILNTSGQTGYGGISSNVQKVEYSDAHVYVSCTCIPGYDIGPWPGNPNQPRNQNFVFSITRTPARNTGTPVQTPLGHIGVWTNGVSMFNAKDARSYNNADVWHQNAILVEGGSFDACLGHPAPNGEYHHHLNPRCLYDDQDSMHHSPIIGYAFDGFPVYGAYGYRNPDGSGGAARMRSSYRLRPITQRSTLPDGSPLQQAQYGPAISTQYPPGYYIEDFEYVQGLGDLDEHNGRFTVTPEYPQGTYAYFVTLNETGEAAYPYTLGPTYYGIVPVGNTGPQSGHNVPSEQVSLYAPSGVERSTEAVTESAWSIFPNPATTAATIQLPSDAGRWELALYDITGNRVLSLGKVNSGDRIALPLASLPAGAYILRGEASGRTHIERVIVR